MYVCRSVTESEVCNLMLDYAAKHGLSSPVFVIIDIPDNCSPQMAPSALNCLLAGFKIDNLLVNYLNQWLF